MKSTFTCLVLTILLGVAVDPCLAMMSIQLVSKERAKELGMELRANAAGSGMVRVVLEFEAKGELKSFSRVDLEVRETGKSVSASLREEGTIPGRVVVSFAADRENLDKITLRVVTQSSERTRTGHDLRVKDFVDLEKVR